MAVYLLPYPASVGSTDASIGMWNRTDPRREHNDKSTFKARRSASDGEEHPELKPITFSCEETLGIRPEQIAEQILDISQWSGFQGYGVLPGIKTAEFEIRTPEIVGSRISVTNTDGSSHVEVVVEWEPDQRVRLHMREFSPPLSRLATRFEEKWEFSRIGQDTRVVRSFELHPICSAARPLLWLISMLLKRAIARHLRQMRESSNGGDT